jgi:hypothetical protein
MMSSWHVVGAVVIASTIIVSKSGYSIVRLRVRRLLVHYVEVHGYQLHYKDCLHQRNLFLYLKQVLLPMMRQRPPHKAAQHARMESTS